MTPIQISSLSRAEWDTILGQVYERISTNPSCGPILRDIGRVQFQFILTDRPDLNFWEEYLEDKVVHHLGVAPACTIEATTSSRVLIGTLLKQISIMEAAADEAYEMRGDTEALMKCANLLPYIMTAFSEAVRKEIVAV